MPDSAAEIILHFVRATKWREESIPPDLERDLHRFITGEAMRLRCSVLAIGGTLNHIHVLVRFSRTITCARFMEEIKSLSSVFINTHSGTLPEDAANKFQWQPGYGVFSVGPNQPQPVIQYIHNQKAHHAQDTVRPAWEAPEQPAKPSSPEGP